MKTLLIGLMLCASSATFADVFLVKLKLCKDQETLCGDVLFNETAGTKLSKKNVVVVADSGASEGVKNIMLGHVSLFQIGFESAEPERVEGALQRDSGSQVTYLYVTKMYGN